MKSYFAVFISRPLVARTVDLKPRNTDYCNTNSVESRRGSLNNFSLFENFSFIGKHFFQKQKIKLQIFSFIYIHI